TLYRLRDDGRVVADWTRSVGRIGRGTENDLINFRSVLTNLHAQRVGAGILEPDVAGISHPVRVALPGPSEALTRRARPGVHHQRVSRARAIDRAAGPVDRVGELDEYRVVPLGIADGVHPHPEV